MAWIEQTGARSWRVRYPKPAGGYGSQSGFASRKEAQQFARDLESDRRHGRWIDPDDAKTTVAAWAARWFDTLDVETRTEENYRAYLRTTSCRAGARRPWVRSPPSRSPGGSRNCGSATPPPPSPRS